MRVFCHRSLRAFAAATKGAAGSRLRPLRELDSPLPRRISDPSLSPGVTAPRRELGIRCPGLAPKWRSYAAVDRVRFLSGKSVDDRLWVCWEDIINDVERCQLTLSDHALK